MRFKIHLVQSVHFINEPRPERSTDLLKIRLLDRGRARSSDQVSRFSIQCFCHDVVYNPLKLYTISILYPFFKLVYYILFLLYVFHQGKKSVNKRSVIDIILFHLSPLPVLIYIYFIEKWAVVVSFYNTALSETVSVGRSLQK